jgi:hypothetical protein
MREAVRQSINGGLRQANSKKTACDIWVIHDALDFFQTAAWNFGINMYKPKDLAVCGARTSVHLYRPTGLAYDNLIAKALREISRAVIAFPVCDNNLCSRRPFAQMRKTLPQQ